jgi:hypothetical protein
VIPSPNGSASSPAPPELLELLSSELLELLLLWLELVSSACVLELLELLLELELLD